MGADEMREVKFQAWHFERKIMYGCVWVGQFECQVLIPNKDKLFSGREIFDWKDTPRGKVVGNIFQNPELVAREESA